jgi:hypothetical protein
MMTLAIAVLMAIQAPQQDSTTQPKPSPSRIMSKMFAHYAGARSAVGTIKMVQTAKGYTVHTETDMQFDRPSLIFIHQVRDGVKGREWFLTSDGKEFSYDRPEDELYGHSRYVEYVTQHSTALTLGDFLLASVLSLGDVNAMIESAVASNEFLKRLSGQWASLVYRGRTTVDGQEVQAVTGQYRDNALSKITGEFEAYINDAGDFVKYVVHQHLRLGKTSGDMVDVDTTWTSNLKIDVPTNPKLYKVIR